MKTNPDNETIELRGRVVVEMVERIKEGLRGVSSPQEGLEHTKRMLGTLSLAIESLKSDADDSKIARQIRRLEKDIQQWEKRKREIESK